MGQNRTFALVFFCYPFFHGKDIIKKQKNAMRFSPGGCTRDLPSPQSIMYSPKPQVLISHKTLENGNKISD